MSVQQPLEDLVLGDAALHFLQPPALFQLSVDLSRIRTALLGLFGDAIVKVLFRRGQAFLLRDRLDHQVPPDLALRHRAEFAGELLALIFRNLVGLGVVLHELLDPALWYVEGIGGDDLIDQLLPDVRFDLVLSVPLHVRANSSPQGLERLEVPNLASECVVERRRGLALHLVERDPNGFRLTPLRFIRKIVGPLYRSLYCPARRQLHDQLLDPGNRLTRSQYQRVTLALARVGTAGRGGDLHVHHIAGQGLLGDRSPRRLLIADLLELLMELLLGNLW